MELQDAINLIKAGVTESPDIQKWADLGCGSGIFTLALSSFLADESTIYAIDKNENQLNTIPDRFNGSKIEKFLLDFDSGKFPFQKMDGILMANSLHYIIDKGSLLNSLARHLRKNGTLIIVEYETLYSNPMVPFPISRRDLYKILDDTGFNNCSYLGERKSRYGHLIYSIGCTHK
jgi:ubiquinone/menaquinone biosynthesis C-methylase UbiE